MTQKCPECGASWDDEATCQDHFHQMLFWENEYPDYGAEVHHYSDNVKRWAQSIHEALKAAR
jgi:hypothetical protein